MTSVFKSIAGDRPWNTNAKRNTTSHSKISLGYSSPSSNKGNKISLAEEAVEGQSGVFTKMSKEKLESRTGALQGAVWVKPAPMQKKRGQCETCRDHGVKHFGRSGKVPHECCYYALILQPISGA